MHVVLPHRHVAFLRQRMGHRAGIGAAERLQLVGGKPDDDFVLCRDDLEQIGLGLLRPRAVRAGQDDNCQTAGLQDIAPREH